MIDLNKAASLEGSTCVVGSTVMSQQKGRGERLNLTHDSAHIPNNIMLREARILLHNTVYGFYNKLLLIMHSKKWYKTNNILYCCSYPHHSATLEI